MNSGARASAPSSTGEVRPNPTSRETSREPKATPPEGLKKALISPSEGSQARTDSERYALLEAQYENVMALVDAIATTPGHIYGEGGTRFARRLIEQAGK